MVDVFISADNIVSPLGFNTKDNIENLKKDKSGIRLIKDKRISQTPIYASLLDSDEINTNFEKIGQIEKYTRLEKMFLLSISDSLKNTGINPEDNDTLIILSTTKGNIDYLEEENKNCFNQNRIFLWKLADKIKNFFHSPNKPVVISNACISGVLAIITAARLIQSSKFKNVIVTGGDIISEFVASGFQSFHSLSEGPCKPFDKFRNGLSLGEGCGTIILTSNEKLCDEEKIIFTGGSTNNDANHISGPSRTGDGLFLALKNTIKEAETYSVKTFDYISAHGTATVYNDEMEALAISRAGLEEVPVNSLKGYYGHTLGATGIIESIVAVHSLKGNFLINTLGFDIIGVSKNINIINKLMQKQVNNCLKTASGFGGCNAAISLSKK